MFYPLPSLRFSGADHPFHKAGMHPGVHVHFFTPDQGLPLADQSDLDAIQKSGMKAVRLDMLWSKVEARPGIYDFSRYESLLDAMKAKGLRPMVILGLENPNYADGLTIYPANTRAAFERYAEAAVRHFKGRGIVWEIIQQPNEDFFFQPKANPDDYAELVNGLVPKLRALDPSGYFAMPSVSGIPLAYLEKTFQRGLLKHVDGLTVHPFQHLDGAKPPETVLPQVDALKQLIRQYAPAGKSIPVLLGEWGYHTARKDGVDEATQARYAVRQALVAAMVGSPVNVWYNWKGDIFKAVDDPDDAEQNFGLVRPQNLVDKPALQALRTMHQQLAGQTFQKRLPTERSDQYVFLFSNGRDRHTLVGWTTGPEQKVYVAGETLKLTGDPVYQALDASRPYTLTEAAKPQTPANPVA